MLCKHQNTQFNLEPLHPSHYSILRVQIAVGHEEFAGLHFTGSSRVFQSLYQKIVANLALYRGFPRIVGETGGKNMHFVHASADLSNVVHSTFRAAFEYQGQKCSACSLVYLPEGLWEQVSAGLIQDCLELEHFEREELKHVPWLERQLASFTGPVINEAAHDRLTTAIHKALQETTYELVYGGVGDKSTGYFLQPTILKTTDPQAELLQTELFGPVLVVHVYADDRWRDVLKQAARAGQYALTASIFAKDRSVIEEARRLMLHCAGNLYINDKCTAAVVGAQPFGGARKSGTNDKAGSPLNLLRWISPRTVKESLLPLASWRYSSNGA